MHVTPKTPISFKYTYPENIVFLGEIKFRYIFKHEDKNKIEVFLFKFKNFVMYILFLFNSMYLKSITLQRNIDTFKKVQVKFIYFKFSFKKYKSSKYKTKSSRGEQP